MRYVIKHSVSGQYLVAFDDQGFGLFSDNRDKAFWGTSEESANTFVTENNLTNVTVSADEGGNNPGQKPPF